VTPHALAGLVALARAQRERDLARLEALLVEDRGLAEEIGRLAALPSQDLAEGGATIAPLQQQALRFAWMEQQITRARKRRAALAAEIARARLAAGTSVGKHEALDRLLAVARRAEVTRRDARAEREAPPPAAGEDDAG
jgi:hypothetical protein